MGKPIYITETGIADAKDSLRAEWAESYFRAVRLLSAEIHYSSTSAAHARKVDSQVRGLEVIVPAHQVIPFFYKAEGRHDVFLTLVALVLLPSLCLLYLKSDRTGACVRLLQVEHAISDGYDVRSFLYWTLVDNFEVRSCLHQQQASPFLPLKCTWDMQVTERLPKPSLIAVAFRPAPVVFSTPQS